VKLPGMNVAGRSLAPEVPIRMRRRPAAKLAVVMGLLIVACGSEAPDPPSSPSESAAPSTRSEGPPNVIVITMDTTRADALGSYGSPLGASPRIDRLAQEGVLFEHVTTSSPSTLPSHATIFTGKHPYAHGARSNVGYVLSDRNTTLAEVLRDAGYRTGAEIAAAVLQESSRIGQGFEHRRDPGSPGVELKQVVHRGETEQSEYPIRVARDIADSGIDFIREHRGEPFLLWLHFFDPHHPYAPPQEYRARYPRQPYLAEVAYMDSQIGRVVDEIERLGLRENTLVVLTSDHGEAKGEHDELSHMYFVYQSTMRTPLILWGLPELKRGLRVTSPVRTADVTPTAVDFAGLPGLEGVQGVSLRGLASGDESAMELTGYGESIELSLGFDVAPLRMVREGRWKYIHKVNPELYDLEADPHERTNLASREPQKIEALRGRMQELLAGSAPQPDDSRVAVDEATRAQLVALGYATPEDSQVSDDELATMALSGSDPNTKIADVETISRAQAHIITEDFEEAHRALLEPIERNPDNGHVLGLMGQALAGLGRHDEATQHFRRAFKLESSKPIHLRGLIDSLEALERDDERIDAQIALIELRPCDSSGGRLNEELHARGRYGDQIRLLAKAAESCPDSPEHLNNHAFALATLPDAEDRDGDEAVKTARLAISKLDSEPGPEYLDTLAVAYAEAGDFPEAIRRGEEALGKAKALGLPQVVLDILGRHLQAYRDGEAVRE